MKMNNIVNTIMNNIKMEQQNSPFLFVNQNLELVNTKAESYSLDLLKKLEIPNSYLFKLEDDWEKIKIKTIKAFLNKANSKPWYRVQIFLIENFSRATLESANSCLKIFEEPWIYNIFFLTNSWESWILDTILSRSITINLDFNKLKIKNDFYYNLILESIENNNSKNLVLYFFKNKLDKNDYISFLDTFILFIKENFIFIDSLEEIFDDKIMIEKNNVIARNIIDKWVLKIINKIPLS